MQPIKIKSFFHYSDTNNTEELFDKVIEGHFEFSAPYWDDVSDSAKNLISQMLDINPESRLTAEEVMSHEWIIVSHNIRF